MSFRILYTPAYNRRARRFLKAHAALLLQYEKALRLLEINPFHPSLRLHRLRSSLSELYSVSINIRYRLTLELLVQEEMIIPVDVGLHDAVYHKK